MSARVLIGIVSYNSSRHLETCFSSLQRQTYRNFTISLWDNASTDATARVLEKHPGVLDYVYFSKNNIGFCAAHNRLISSTLSEYVLVLNPDIILEPNFLEILVQKMDEDPSAGSATGKLLRWTDASCGARTMDSAGVYLTKNQRHFDRGSDELDVGQYDKDEYVFGASGAAALYRRSMLEDIREGAEYFDESFFAYREDVDLAWRAQWMGWRCRYIPQAIALHERKVLPERRASLPSAINMHSFKNRFLLRIKNMDCGTYARFFLPITARDLAALAYVLLREQSSLTGVSLLIRALPRAYANRKSLRARRKSSPQEMRQWFCRKAFECQPSKVSRAANLDKR
jgi:GT2 family glycosyltransferase